VFDEHGALFALSEPDEEARDGPEDIAVTSSGMRLSLLLSTLVRASLAMSLLSTIACVHIAAVQRERLCLSLPLSTYACACLPSSLNSHVCLSQNAREYELDDDAHNPMRHRDVKVKS
jgi:hypothetical protein